MLGLWRMVSTPRSNSRVVLILEHRRAAASLMSRELNLKFFIHLSERSTLVFNF